MRVLLGHELIGKEVCVVDAANPAQKGMKGTVVDETKNTIVMSVRGKKKRLPKRGITLHIGGYIMKGALLVGRPEERLKVKL